MKKIVGLFLGFAMAFSFVASAGAQPSITEVDAIVNGDDYRPGDDDTLRLYRAFFDRDADYAGGRYWIEQSRAGVSYDDMAWGFANSQEFKNKYGTVSNRSFLRIVYVNVLHRDPDPAGFMYWDQQIQNGLPRHLVVRWIAASDEFKARYPYIPDNGFTIVGPPTLPDPVLTPLPVINFKNCTEVRAAGAAPIYVGDPGYGPHLDRDGNGIGCQ